MTDHTLTVTLNLDTEKLAAELRETLRETLRRHIATALMADRYAANEAKQREEAEPEWPEGFDGYRESHDWGLLTRAEKQVVIERWIASQRLNAAEREAKAEKARADFAAAVAAANAAREAAGGDLSASEGESEAEEGGEAEDAQGAILCPECGDHINTHDIEGCAHLCDCPRTPEDIAHALIAEAVKPEQAVEQAGGGHV